MTHEISQVSQQLNQTAVSPSDAIQKGLQNVLGDSNGTKTSSIQNPSDLAGSESGFIERLQSAVQSGSVGRAVSPEAQRQVAALTAELEVGNLTLSSLDQSCLIDGLGALETLSSLVESTESIAPEEFAQMSSRAQKSLHRAATVVEQHRPEAAKALIAASKSIAASEVTNDFYFKTEPASPKAIADFHKTANRAALETVNGLPGLPEAVVAEISNAIGQDSERYADPSYQERSAVLTPKEIKKKMGGKLMNGFLKKIKSPGTIKAAIKEAISIRKFKSAGAHGKPFPQDLKGVHKEKALAAFIKGRVEAAGLKAPSVEKIFKSIHRDYGNVLNQRAWPVISNSNIQVGQGHDRQYASSTLTPAAKLSPVLQSSYGNLGGISSLSNREENHAVNLWRTEFSVDGSDQKFTAFRHGVHDAYKIKDPEVRAQAADNRVAETIQAMVAGASDRLQKQPDGSYKLDVISVNLQTAGKLAGEKDMIANQLNAYERANGKSLTVETGGVNGLPPTIQVKPNFIAFSVGVNSLAGSGFEALSGWNSVNKSNVASAEALVGDLTQVQLGGLAGVAAERARAQGDETKAAFIEDLGRQVKLILNAADGSKISQTSGEHEPYKLATRLVALANEVGSAAAFNCKSGKDRTGQLDVELKDFYRFSAQNEGKVRPLEYERSLGEKQSFRNILEHGGAREVQLLNTGVPGTKSQTTATYEALGIPKASFDTLKGLSGYVGS